MSGPLAVPYEPLVPPAWIDYNRHMTEGYYGLAFANASDAVLEMVGFDAAYRAAAGGTIYTAEAHILFLRELKLGDRLRFTAQFLGADARRLHLFHRLFQAEAGYLAATQEVIFLHVNQEQRRVVEMPASVQASLHRLVQAHASLPWPEQAGRRVTMRRSAAAGETA